MHLSDAEGAFSVECLIFDCSQQGVRALFKHGSFEVADRLLRYIQGQKQDAMLEVDTVL